MNCGWKAGAADKDGYAVAWPPVASGTPREWIAISMDAPAGLPSPCMASRPPARTAAVIARVTRPPKDRPSALTMPTISV